MKASWLRNNEHGCATLSVYVLGPCHECCMLLHAGLYGRSNFSFLEGPSYSVWANLHSHQQYVTVSSSCRCCLFSHWQSLWLEWDGISMWCHFAFISWLWMLAFCLKSIGPFAFHPLKAFISLPQYDFHFLFLTNYIDQYFQHKVYRSIKNDHFGLNYPKFSLSYDW